MGSKQTDSSFKVDDHEAISDRFIAIGVRKLIFIITIVTALVAVVMAYVLVLLFADQNIPTFLVLSMAAFIPIVITPAVVWPLVGGLLNSINKQRELYMTATYDMLTGCLSRNAFFSNLQSLYDLSIRNNTPFSIISIDVDEFKQINDVNGHAAGDDVLRALGRLLTNAVRKSDFIGRIGGDEFVLVLPYTAVSEANNIAENIRGLVSELPIFFDGKRLDFTLSIGISLVNTLKHQPIDDLLLDSDKALYQAKESGRNCIVTRGHLNPD